MGHGAWRDKVSSNPSEGYEPSEGLIWNLKILRSAATTS